MPVFPQKSILRISRGTTRSAISVPEVSLEHLDIAVGLYGGFAVSAVPAPPPTLYLLCDFDSLRPDETWPTVGVAVLITHAHTVPLLHQRNKVLHPFNFHIVLLEPGGTRHVFAVVPFMRSKHGSPLPSPGHDIRQPLRALTSDLRRIPELLPWNFTNCTRCSPRQQHPKGTFS